MSGRLSGKVSVISGTGGGSMVSMQSCHLTEPADCRAPVELALGTFGRSTCSSTSQDVAGPSRPAGGSGERDARKVVTYELEKGT